MSFQHLEGNFSNTCQEIRSLLADMYYTPSLTLCKVNVYTYLRVFLQAYPFAILLLRIGISLPFQKLERRRPPVFRLRKRAYRSVDFSDKEKRDSKAQAGSLLVNCFFVAHCVNNFSSLHGHMSHLIIYAHIRLLIHILHSSEVSFPRLYEGRCWV